MLLSFLEAKSLNLPRYFTGKMCKHGHVSERYTATRTCITCSNIDSAKRIAKNHEAQLARQKAWRIANPEKMQATSKRWLKNNKAKNALKKRNRDSAKIHRTPSWLNNAHFFEIECVYSYCASLRSIGLNYEVDHIVPLQGKTVSGLHVPWNLQVITKFENRSKGNKEVCYSTLS
jgi:hypothetical protein